MASEGIAGRVTRLHVSVGVCVHNEEENISGLVQAVLREPVVDELIVVASGCTDGTVDKLNAFAQDPRVKVIVEPQRTGKTSAFNFVLAAYQGDFLVSLPGDVMPEPGTIARLVAAFRDDVGVVGGLPIPVNGMSTVMDRVAHLVWAYHNEALRRLADRGILGHVSGEIFALRRGVVDRLPPETVLDDSGIALAALHAGYRIAVEPEAIVHIQGARTPRDFMIQRRRNLVGHRQLQDQRAGYSGPPSLAFSNGLAESAEALRAVLARSPRLAFVLPAAVTLEGASRILAWFDWRRGETHRIWEMATSTKKIG